MAHVVVPQHHGIAALIRRAEIFLVPINDQLLPIWVLRRNQDHDHILQNVLDLGTFARRQLVCELGRALRAGNLSRVNVAGDHNHRFAFHHQLLRLLRSRDPRIGQLSLDLLVAIQMGNRVRRRDRHRNVGTPLCCLADFFKVNAIRFRAQFLKVGNQLCPIRQLAIRARFKSKGLCRGSNMLRWRGKCSAGQ